MNMRRVPIERTFQIGLPVPLIVASPRVFVVTGLFFLIASSVFIYSVISTPAAAEVPRVSAAGGTIARPLEIHIAATGLVLLRSAKIVSIAGNIIVVNTAWESGEFNWIIKTNASQYETREFGTKFWTRDGKKINIGQFEVGDAVTITGALQKSATALTVEADSVRHSQ